MDARWGSLLLAAVVGAGIAVAAGLFWPEPRATRDGAVADVVPAESPRLAATLRALREELGNETEARERLVEELAALRARLARLEERAPVEVSAAAPADGAGSTIAGARPADKVSFDERSLVGAGVDLDDARWLHERYDAYEMQRLYLMDQADREGWEKLPGGRRALSELERELRKELGEPRYDQFLYALGRNNRVVVNDVLSRSPAEDAGFRERDVVLRYDDARIYSTQQLRKATRGGQAGELIAVELQRKGERIRVFVPRGPLGVTLETDRRAPDVG